MNSQSGNDPGRAPDRPAGRMAPDRFYTAADMARIASFACEGCGACCRGMGDSVRLDPYDVHLLAAAAGRSFAELMQDGVIGLAADDGLLIPHLKMRPDTDDCPFLGADGRCGVHESRPGICRLFPLGRDYADGGFRYFIVPGGCAQPGRAKVRISDWLGVPDVAAWERFVAEWHYFVRRAQQAVTASGDPDYAGEAAMFVLKVFYLTPYGGAPGGADSLAGFLETFDRRLAAAEEAFS